MQMGDPPEHALPAGVDSLLEHEILKAALDAAEVGYAFENCQSGAITVSRVFQKMLGMAEDTFVTSIETLAALAALAIEVDGPDLASARAMAVESGQRHTLNARIRCADGLSTILLRIAVRPVRGPSGDIASIVYFAWDVTESPELRAALTRERFAYQQAQKLARVGHFVVDAESGEVLTSPVLAELLGLEPADGPIAMDDILKRVMTPEEIAESGRRRDTLMATEEAYDVEVDIHAADSGESRILAVRMEARSPNASGSPRISRASARPNANWRTASRCCCGPNGWGSLAISEMISPGGSCIYRP
jgi:PAS domain-containing protein